MNNEIEMLIKDVKYLKDRLEILDCVNRYARGLDRHDVDILLQAYHENAVDEHGRKISKAAEYPDWINEQHSLGTKMHNHNITTHNCEIVGDVANAESYVLCGLALKEGNNILFGCGRYIDQLDRRNGSWKITLRRTMMDWMFTADGSVFEADWYKAEKYPVGTRGRDDISYQRPLRVDPENQSAFDAILDEPGGVASSTGRPVGAV